MNSRAKPQQTPSVEKHAHPPRVVYCAIYSTLTRLTKFRVRNLHITSTQYAANTLHQRIFPREAIPSHYFPLREDLSRVLAWGLHGLGNSGLAVVIIPFLTPNVKNSRAKLQQTPSAKKHAHLPRWFTALYTQHFLD